MKIRKQWFAAVFMILCLLASSFGLAGAAESVYSWNTFTVATDAVHKLVKGSSNYDLYLQKGASLTLTADYVCGSGAAETIQWSFINQTTGEIESIACTEPSYTFTFEDEGVLVFSSQTTSAGQTTKLEKTVCLYEYSLADLLNVEREYTANEVTQIWFMPEYLNPVAYKEYVADKFIRDWNGDGTVTVDELNQNVTVTLTTDLTLDEGTTYEFTNEANMVTGRLCIDLGVLSAADHGKTVTLTLENINGEQFTAIYTLKHNGLTCNPLTVTSEASLEISESEDGIFVFAPQGANLSFVDGTAYTGSKEVSFTYEWTFYDYTTYTETTLAATGKECVLTAASDGALTCNVEAKDSNGNILGWITSEAVILVVESPEEDEPEPPVWNGFIVYSTGTHEYDTNSEVPVLYLEKGAMTIVEADYTCDPVGSEAIGWYFQNLSTGEMETLECTGKTYLFSFEDEGNIMFVSRDDKGILLEKYIYLREYQNETEEIPEFSATSKIGVNIPKGISPFLNSVANELFIRDYNGDGEITAEELNEHVNMSIAAGDGIQLVEQTGFANWTDPADGTTNVDFAGFVFMATSQQAQDKTIVATVTNSLGDTYYHKLTVDLVNLVRKGLSIESSPAGTLTEDKYGNYELVAEEGATITFTPDYETLSGEEADLSYEWWAYSYDLGENTTAEPLSTERVLVVTDPVNNCEYSCTVYSKEDGGRMDMVSAMVTLTPKKTPDPAVWNGFTASATGENKEETRDGVQYLFAEIGAQITVTADYLYEASGTEQISWTFCDAAGNVIQTISSEEKNCTFTFEEDGYLNFIVMDSGIEEEAVNQKLFVSKIELPTKVREKQLYTENEVVTVYFDPEALGHDSAMEYVAEKFICDWDEDGEISVEELNNNVKVSWVSEVKLVRNATTFKFADKLNISSTEALLFDPGDLQANLGNLTRDDNGKVITLVLENTAGDVFTAEYVLTWNGAATGELTVTSDDDFIVESGWDGSISVRGLEGSQITFTDHTVYEGSEQASCKYNWYFIEWGSPVRKILEADENVCELVLEKNGNLFCEATIIHENGTVGATIKHQATVYVTERLPASVPVQFNVQTTPAAMDGYIFAAEGETVTIHTNAVCEKENAEIEFYWSIDTLDENGEYVSGEVQENVEETFVFEAKADLNGKKISCQAQLAGTSGHEDDDTLAYILVIEPVEGTVIESEAFSGVAFADVYLPEDIKSIESRAFADSEVLQNVYFPDRNVKIADDAFSGCTNVCFYVYPNTYAEAYANNRNIPVEYLAE